MKRNSAKQAAIAKRARDKIRATTEGKLRHRIEVALRAALKGMKAGRGWETLVGYNVYQLKVHLEDRFTPGMTWERFHAGDIHIDHIKPVYTFRITSTDDPAFKECWALKNLQPLWVKDHLVKCAAENTERAKTRRMRIKLAYAADPDELTLAAKADRLAQRQALHISRLRRTPKL